MLEECPRAIALNPMYILSKNLDGEGSQGTR
jgi:hypothetical protein